MRRISIRAAATIIAAATLVSCSHVHTSVNGTHTWTKPGYLRVAMSSDIKSLNPLLAGTTKEIFITNLMFEPLVSANQVGDTIPMLAAVVPTKSNGGISSDGLTITYHLRKNAHWTDGYAVTSQDVIFSWKAIMNPNNNVVSRHGYDDIVGINSPNQETLVVHLKKPFAPFVDTFFGESDQPYEIVPEHILARYPNINEIPFNSAPTVSDGPFKFVRWVHGDRVVLAPNTTFFMGRPKLKRLDVRFIPDENTEVGLLQSHQIDWILEASPHIYPLVAHIDGVRVAENNVNGYEGMVFNTQSPALRDVRVRRAIAYAIDKSQLVKTLTFGQDQPATGDIPSWMWAYPAQLATYPFDPATAKRLLAQSGTPTPHLTLILTTGDATRRQAAVLIQSMLHAVGIETTIKTFPEDVLYAPAAMGGIMQRGAFDLAISPWFAGIDPDNASQYTCIDRPPGGYNYALYCSPEMDAAQHDALAHYTRAKRTIAYAKIEGLIHRDVPQLFFWWYRQLQPINSDFHGLAPNPVGEAWNAWKWNI